MIELRNYISKNLQLLSRSDNYKVKYLNKRWNLTHLNRKEILNNLEFIECGYIFHFNGFDKAMRAPIMEQTWEKIKNEY